jgi:hypothetical protein
MAWMLLATLDGICEAEMATIFMVSFDCRGEWNADGAGYTDFRGKI